ncbi:hypothetical protein HMI54_003734 [Coelomomyces lativittatus]|nr:hypothetical protein HMI54_003734 [Coelomomyces lativittatus]
MKSYTSAQMITYFCTCIWLSPFLLVLSSSAGDCTLPHSPVSISNRRVSAWKLCKSILLALFSDHEIH